MPATPDEPRPPNLHATALVAGDRGVLIRGRSGSGKTTLALALMARCHASARYAAIVGDDQVLLLPRGGRLICRAPPPVEGLVEVWGRVPQPIQHQEAAIIDLVVELVDGHTAPRYAEDRFEEIGGCRLPLLVLAGRNVHGALPALASRLGLHPFG